MSYRKCEELLQIFEIKLNKENPKDNPLYFATNFLLVALNLYEVWNLISREYPLLNAAVNNLTTHIIHVAWNFIEEMKEDKIRVILYEKDFDNRDSLEIISNHNICDLLNNKNMEKVAIDVWESEYDIKGNLIECSSAFTILKANTFTTSRDYVKEYLFFSFKHRNLSKVAHHIFQFQIWK